MTSEKMLLKNKNIPGLVAFILLLLVPFLAAFLYALLHSFGLVGLLNEGFTFEYWQTVLDEGRFVKSFLYSSLVAAISVASSIALSIFSVLLLHRHFEKPLTNFLLYLPLAVPGIVTAFLVYQTLSRTALLSRIAFHIGMIEQASSFPDLVNDELALGIMIAFISLLSPFFTLYYMNLYRNENLAALENLAKTLGATSWSASIRVSLPILLKRSWILIVLYFIFLLGAYEVPLVLGQESPQMLSVLIIEEIRQYDLEKISTGYAMASLYTLVVSAAVLLLLSNKKRPLHAD
jgi:putative spermidine/putrescine transport system permease protein